MSHDDADQRLAAGAMVEVWAQAPDAFGCDRRIVWGVDLRAALKTAWLTDDIVAVFAPCVVD